MVKLFRLGPKHGQAYCSKNHVGSCQQPLSGRNSAPEQHVRGPRLRATCANLRTLSNLGKPLDLRIRVIRQCRCTIDYSELPCPVSASLVLLQNNSGDYHGACNTFSSWHCLSKGSTHVRSICIIGNSS